MFIYSFVLLLALFLSFIYDRQVFNKSRILPYVILCIIVILVSGFRYRVGIDTLNYMEVYASLPSIDNIADIFDSENNLTIRPLYLLLVVIAKLFSNEFYVCQLIHAAILNIIIFYFLWKESRHPFFCVIMYLFVYFFYFNMEIMRESLAVAIFLLARNSLFERKWLRYYSFVFLASLFHYSAFLMLIYPFVVNLKLNKHFVYIGLFIILGMIWLKPVVMTILGVIDSTLLVRKIIGFMEYSDSTFAVKTFLMQLLKYSILPFIVLYMYKRCVAKSFKYESLVLFHVLIGIGVVFYQVIFARFTNYTQPFCVLLYAEFIYLIYRTFLIRNIFCVVTTIIIAVIILFDYNIQPVAGVKRFSQWIPYYSIFNPQRDNLRESIWFKTFE